jgi:hypothetical protein
MQRIDEGSSDKPLVALFAAFAIRSKRTAGGMNEEARFAGFITSDVGLQPAAMLCP